MSDDSRVGVGPHLIALPEGTTHLISFIWAPIPCKSKEEAVQRLAEIGDAATPEEYFRNKGDEKVKLFSVEKVIKLIPPKKKN